LNLTRYNIGVLYTAGTPLPVGVPFLKCNVRQSQPFWL